MSEAAFDQGWAARATVGHASRAAVGWMIDRHYLRCWPAITRCIFGLRVDGAALGVVVFADSPTQTSARYGGPTWELARLWASDDLPRNTESWLIARSVRHVIAEHREVAALVSYADPAAGHAGTIYRAANWCPDGMTDDERASPRSDYIVTESGEGLFGRVESSHKVGRAAHVRGRSVVKSPRVSKHRFVMRLPRRRAAPSLWDARHLPEPI